MIWLLAACTPEVPAPPPQPVVVPKAPPVVVHRYVSASTLNLRDAPSPSSQVLRRLPINTPLKVEGTQGDFAQVRTPSGQQGWVGAAFLAKEQLSLDAAKSQLEQAETAEEKLSWAQRAAALAPIDEDVLKALAEQYEATGQPKLAAQVKARLGELSGGRFERCIPSGQRAQLTALGKQLDAVSTMAELKQARLDAMQVSRAISETLGQLYDYEADTTCGERDVDWLKPLLPGLDIAWNPEGMGVHTDVSVEAFRKAAARTPESEDDVFIGLIGDLYGNVEGTGWASFEERDWDYGGCSTFGSEAHLALLKRADTLAASPFADVVTALRKRVIDDVVTDDAEYFPFCKVMGTPTPKQKLVAELDRILAEVKLTDEERARLEERKAKGFPLNP